MQVVAADKRFIKTKKLNAVRKTALRKNGIKQKTLCNTQSVLTYT